MFVTTTYDDEMSLPIINFIILVLEIMVSSSDFG